MCSSANTELDQFSDRGMTSVLCFQCVTPSVQVPDGQGGNATIYDSNDNPINGSRIQEVDREKADALLVCLVRLGC
jgi:hypothetical protein